MLQSIAKNAGYSADEAGECVMNILFAKFENMFADVAIKKDVALDGMPQKMGIVSTEAMLSEAHIGK
jgi:hypothetical protein